MRCRVVAFAAKRPKAAADATIAMLRTTADGYKKGEVKEVKEVKAVKGGDALLVAIVGLCHGWKGAQHDRFTRSRTTPGGIIVGGPPCDRHRCPSRPPPPTV